VEDQASEEPSEISSPTSCEDVTDSDPFETYIQRCRTDRYDETLGPPQYGNPQSFSAACWDDSAWSYEQQKAPHPCSCGRSDSTNSCSSSEFWKQPTSRSTGVSSQFQLGSLDAEAFQRLVILTASTLLPLQNQSMLSTPAGSSCPPVQFPLGCTNARVLVQSPLVHVPLDAELQKCQGDARAPETRLSPSGPLWPQVSAAISGSSTADITARPTSGTAER
jgi:hypothetical protein